MMRKMTTAGLLLAAALATPAFGQAFLGEWNATAHTQGADSAETLSVTKAGDGYAITGKPAVEPPEGYKAGPGKDVVLEGNTFSYTRVLTIPNSAIEITYKGVVTGDTFSGTAEVAGTTIPYTGVRLTAGK